MTTNWFALEGRIAERNRAVLAADARRWPDVAHAHRVQNRVSSQAGYGADTRPQEARRLTAGSTVHRLSQVFRGLLPGHAAVQR